MSKSDEDGPFPGLSVHLDAMRLDKAVKERIKERLKPNPEDPPTNPGVPRAKRRQAAERCSHGIKPELCEECKLLLEHGGRYSIVNVEPQEGGKKE